MTAARKPEPDFRVHGRVALCTVTVTAVAVYTDARCPGCQRLIMAIPGLVTLEVRRVATTTDRSGRGRVVTCKRCGLCEVIEHE
ncbi:MAG TPA: hypothetical protein VJK71_08545 [Gemmatimonadales bacterium]|nr:hypothetical protein [Gemmatimonadales bacterium]